MTADTSRRRTDPDSEPVINDPQPQKAFEYQPLDPDPNADSIRLVLIDQSPNQDNPLSCRLIHVKFAEKPKYKALSYVWGDELVKEQIILDGTKFYVGRNLCDALHYLRSSGNLMPIWIDAICINQNDIEERNKQLRMMRWIYFRADTVVVWLGRKYSIFQQRIRDLTGRDSVPLPTEEDKSQTGKESTTDLQDTTEAKCLRSKEGVEDATNVQREMYKELVADGYWSRLWIIQEIGRGHRHEVCFGTLAMSWDAFIEFVTLHHSNSEGPLRLDRLLKKKYCGSHTLRRLLVEHRAALCKDPRDKIYGLIGMAADAVGFPMDYKKSLIEIWTDTMVFMNRRGLLQEPDIIPFGGLIKSLLIGFSLGPLEQALQPYELRPSETLKSPEVFKLCAYVVGCIIVVGPSPAEIVSSLSKADEWADEIRQNFRKELGDAHQENDTLIRSIIESDEHRIASACFSHVSNIRWVPDFRYEPYFRYEPPRGGWSAYESYKSLISERSFSRNQTNTGNNLSPPESSHLFLARNPYSGETANKMGMASNLAQPGDLVCWVPGIERALVLRVQQTNGINCQVFGTALFTEDFESTDKGRHAKRLSKFGDEETIELQIDAMTIYVLLA